MYNGLQKDQEQKDKIIFRKMDTNRLISPIVIFNWSVCWAVPVLMLLYSIVAGTGLGLMYVPAVVAVGYYFEKKRAFATGTLHSTVHREQPTYKSRVNVCTICTNML